jgi:hypothetical protein
MVRGTEGALSDGTASGSPDAPASPPRWIQRDAFDLDDGVETSAGTSLEIDGLSVVW